MYAYFNRFIIQMTKNQARACSHQGQCDNDVKAALEIPAIQRQLKRINPDDIRAELRECGAWDDTELESDYENQMRIVWLAAGDINELIPVRQS